MIWNGIGQAELGRVGVMMGLAPLRGFGALIDLSMMDQDVPIPGDVNQR